MSGKERLSASVDSELLAAAQAAVADGLAANVSAWVNEALIRQVAHDRRLRALDDFLAAFESQHGAITDREMRDADRRARGGSVAKKGGKRGRAATVRKRGAA